MTMVARAFVDTNIVLRAFHSTFSEHGEVKALFDRLIVEKAELYISRQVIREYLVQTTHPRTFVEPLTMDVVTGHLEQVTNLCKVLDDTVTVTTQLLSLLKAYPTRGKQIHDANVVATMLANDIDVLLTLNVDDFKRFDDKITLISPSKYTPEQ